MDREIFIMFGAWYLVGFVTMCVDLYKESQKPAMTDSEWSNVVWYQKIMVIVFIPLLPLFWVYIQQADLMDHRHLNNK